MAQNLCGYPRETITQALKVIQKICSSNTCQECPFGYDSKGCRFQDYAPSDLEIANSESVWKALK